MGDLRINIRIFAWHFQVGNNWRCTFTYNDYHKGLKHGWFAVYEFRPFKKGAWINSEKVDSSNPSQP